ncbi:putative nucleotidyltransferase substrate binding domain-containing protein [Aliiroseovarius marinus]|uniref:putative nucleotidyltransferase substrate binding domain-containing protein n=1 Tax=Aliiroseovarius marinus TaxID=2500159 RepID=UPI003D7ED4BC
MPLTQDQIFRFLKSVHPYDALDAQAVEALVPALQAQAVSAGDAIYALGEDLPGIYIIHEGEVEVFDENGVMVSHLGLRNSFGERGLLREGKAVTSATAATDATLLVLPAEHFHALLQAHDQVRRFFDRSRSDRASKQERQELATTQVDTFMASSPVTCPPDTTVQEAAIRMRDARVSSICVTEGDVLTGILTTRDMSGKVLAAALPIDTNVTEIMTPNPITLAPSAIGSDVLHVMMERRIGHVPIVEAGKLVGIVSQTDLTRFQAVSSAELVREIAQANTPEEMRDVTERIPQLLVQLVAGGSPHQVVTRLITDIADTCTRRLLALGEAKLGPAPVPYLWAACGSQGRQEQTGVSDQDNCLILSDDVSDDDRDGYFTELAKFVCDGLDVCGYFYCPGDMMATNPRWCQPLSVWRGYFDRWVAKPDPEAQMLASVMFDLRAISGDESLFAGLQKDTLKLAAKNSIFVAHMVSNSLKHTPPLGLLRGFATIRSGEHKNQLDMKHNGVVPIVDLGRVYALQGQLTEANTRARLEAAIHAGGLSQSGGQDLLDAYDLIADTRLEHQAEQVKAGAKPDNYLSPSDLSEFERSHLRDAFVVVKSMQSAIGHGRGMLG